MVLFERAAAAGSQLMQVQREHSASESESGKFLLTFDVGRILVRDGGDALVAEHLESSDEIPAGMVNATDEEPWWRVLGSPLVRVWSVPEVSSYLGGVDSLVDPNQHPRRARLSEEVETATVV